MITKNTYEWSNRRRRARSAPGWGGLKKIGDVNGNDYSNHGSNDEKEFEQMEPNGSIVMDLMKKAWNKYHNQVSHKIWLKLSIAEENIENWTWSVVYLPGSTISPSPSIACSVLKIPFSKKSRGNKTEDDQWSTNNINPFGSTITFPESQHCKEPVMHDTDMGNVGNEVIANQCWDISTNK